MTREYLESLGLEKDVIDKIMAEHGKGIEKIKTEVKTRETEVETLQGQLKTANKEIEGFKDLDVEGIKKAAEDYKTKYEEAEQKAKEELEKIKFNHEMETMARDLKAKNTKAVIALLDKDELLESKNRKEDMQKAFENIAKENEFLFELEGEDKDKKAKFTRPNGGGEAPKMTKEEFNKLSYVERNDMFMKDKSLYDELTK